MKRALISQQFRQDLKPLVPVCKPSPKCGRPRCDDRAAFNGILFVLMTGMPWEDLPQELGFGSGMTCWPRLRKWQAASVWDGLHQHCFTVCVSMTKSLVSRVPQWRRRLKPPGGQETRPNPTDRGKLGSKRRVLTDARGVPLAILVSGVNRHNLMLFEDLIDAVQPVGGCKADRGKGPTRCMRTRAMTTPSAVGLYSGVAFGAESRDAAYRAVSD